MNKIGILLVASTIVGVITSSTQAQSLTVEKRRIMTVEAVQYDGNDFLLSDRRVCAKQRVYAAKQEIESNGTSFPAPEAYCLAVLEETAKRNRTNDLYISISPAHIDDLLLRIVKASLRKKTIIASVGNMPLPCSLALDAGFLYGITKPNASNKKSAEYGTDFKTLTRDCYDPAKKVSSLNGLIAGVHAGQRWAKNNSQ